MNNVQLKTACAVVLHRVTSECRCVSLLQLTRLVGGEIVRRSFTAMMIIIVLWTPLEVDTGAIHNVAWRRLVLRCARRQAPLPAIVTICGLLEGLVKRGSLTIDITRLIAGISH